MDFIMGRLTAEQAFGPSRAGSEFAPGERPDIGVDIYDSGLRDAEAPLRENARMERFVKVDRWVKSELKGMEGDARAERLAAFTELALALPRWFMKREYHAFDHVHPGIEGHRVIAQTMCGQMPDSWGCECSVIPTLEWSRKAKGLVPAQPVSP